MTRPAVFLDRDGTIIEECGYLQRLDRMKIFPWTPDALRLLKRAGFTIIVITNQAAVGRGIIEESFVSEVHRELDARLSGTGGSIDGYYYCPHFAESRIERYRQVCSCRKPGPGMIQQACRELGLDPSQSFMVGDRWSDVQSGKAAGTRAVFVRSGPMAAEADAPPEGVQPDAILDNLMEAAGWILRNSSR